MSEDLSQTTKTQPEVKTDLKIPCPSLDVLPQELIGRYGLEGEVMVRFRSLEERQLYHLGKLLSADFYDKGKNHWDRLYQHAKENGKLLVVHASFDSFAIEKMRGLRSTSIISPGNDVIAHYAGYVYELDVEKILALFASDSQVRSKPYEGCIKSQTRDGRTIYHRGHPQINISDLPNLVEPRRQQSCADAIVDFDVINKQIRPIAIFNRLQYHQEWEEEARLRRIPYIPNKPYLDHSATEEINKYTEAFTQSSAKTHAEIKDLAMQTYNNLRNQIIGKKGNVIIGIERA